MLFSQKLIFLFVILQYFVASNNASGIDDYLPPSRRIDWKPGVPGGIPQRSVICSNVKTNYNAKGDGTTDDSTAFQNALDACPSGQVVFVPEGIYKFTQRLEIPSGVVLRGESPQMTV